MGTKVFHQPVFKKVALTGLNSLRQKGYQILVKNWIFDDLPHKKGPLLVILVTRMIQPSGSAIFLMKWGCRGHWGHWGCRGCWGHWGCRGSKAWKITTGDFRVIHVLEFSFILMFWKNIFFGLESWNIKLNFSTISVRGCWGQPMLLFWKLIDKTQMGNPPGDAVSSISWKFSIFLPIRAILKKPYHYETPCTYSIALHSFIT